MGNGWKKKPMDKMEMLHTLGHIYAMTASGFGSGGLQGFIQKNGKPTIAPKAPAIVRAMLRIELLHKKGVRGRGRSYKWNLADYGPVSIPIAEMIIRETEHQINIDAARKRESKKARMRNEQQG